MLVKYLNDLKILNNYIKNNSYIFKKNKFKKKIFLVEFNGW